MIGRASCKISTYPSRDKPDDAGVSGMNIRTTYSAHGPHASASGSAHEPHTSASGSNTDIPCKEVIETLEEWARSAENRVVRVTHILRESLT